MQAQANNTDHILTEERIEHHLIHRLAVDEPIVNSSAHVSDSKTKETGGGVKDNRGKYDGVNLESDGFIPLDKQMQGRLVYENPCWIAGGVGGHTERVQVDAVDNSPLPWECLGEVDGDEACLGENYSEVALSDSNQVMEDALEVLTPMLEDIVAAGLISKRWSRANANMSVYFKCHKLYSVKKNAPFLANKMTRPRAIPERYFAKFDRRQRIYRLGGFLDVCSLALRRELSCRMKIDGVQNAVFDLYEVLKRFLAALVAAAPWDSTSSFDICLELYIADVGSCGYEKALCLLESNGCSVEQIAVVTSLIAKCKNEWEI